MTRLAFYAPMKPPSHPVPSGDRTMARALMAALGPGAELVSDLTLRDGAGNRAAQAALRTKAGAEAARLIARGGWDAWITYHSYYKAPDLIGPAVTSALGLPYILVEATRAAKRLDGPWADFARAAEDACDAANAIFYMTRHDAESLLEARNPGQQILPLPPFLSRENLPPAAAPQEPVILAAGMFRTGDKLASYRAIAAALAHLTAPGWRLHIAGEGPARPEVEALLAPFAPRDTFLGELGPEGLAAAYACARAFLWPGVNEAFGMVYLEAQAAGVPVVAEDRPGPRDVLPPAALVPQDRPEAMAASLDRLLTDRAHHAARAAEARALIADRHLLGAARARLWSALSPLIERPAP
ncbi:Glycosyltransferase involved in cell wall bisynthesis [Salinihabitans flavidus]|uniref:Glycosyltransferase involved in cell wall bisynthesis n=1 Tax=Salinihabitans flavidus TaxID=569882 RepID=A0A1H8MTZ3_9RHOB|nr:glycosyltransferase family 4 protein [Salinihabitans flavidus]SEO20704.1 Glycosyltransferase involved in cell wall bisynthesis [Salinihabitans flavidus]